MLIELLKAFFIGVVEGITEWLPISSTGHMILVDQFVKLNVSADFLKVFLVVIQLGAIMAVIVLYFRKLNPFALSKSKAQKRRTWSIWGRVLIATIPAGIIGVLFDDWVQNHLYTAFVVALMLVIYGVAFIAIERHNRHRIEELGAVGGKHSKAYLASHDAGGADDTGDDEHAFDAARDDFPSDGVLDEHGLAGAAATTDFIKAYEAAPDGSVVVGTDGRKRYVEKIEQDASSAISSVNSFSEMSLGKALIIGLFQCLAVIPGTSRSGATIVGAMLLGVSRSVAAEFSFYLAIPVMFGWSLVKFLKHGLAFSTSEIAILAVGCITAFVVSILAIKFLVGYIKRNDFTVFGWYRIILGLIVIGVLVIPTLL